jgi:hypothetical protein
MEILDSLNKYYVSEKPLSLPATDVSYSSINSKEMSSEYDNLIQVGIWIVTCVIGYFILAKINNLDAVKYPYSHDNQDKWWSSNRGLVWWLWITPIVLSFIITIKIMENILESRLPKLVREKKMRLEAKNQSLIIANKQEAKRTTEAAKDTLISSYNALEKLNDISCRVVTSIKCAETEFKDNAFSPFWDQIENIIEEFANYNYQLSRITKIHEEYNTLLINRTHNFPEFPINNNILPNIKLHLREFKQVVRLGQTNYEFASIYEHRKTREVIIAGFNNLAEALHNIDATVLEAYTEYNLRFDRLLVEIRNTKLA